LPWWTPSRALFRYERRLYRAEMLRRQSRHHKVAHETRTAVGYRCSLRFIAERFTRRGAPFCGSVQETREYLAYMDPALIWQLKFRARPEEVLEACRMFPYHLKRGERADWAARARELLLNARELLKPGVTDHIRPSATKHHCRVELKAWIPHAQVDGTDPSAIFLGLTEFSNKGDLDVAVPRISRPASRTRPSSQPI
jgi:hypothetical protein